MAQRSEAWRRYLADTPADALFILGDLSRSVGDDAADGPDSSDCARILSKSRATPRHPFHARQPGFPP